MGSHARARARARASSPKYAHRLPAPDGRLVEQARTDIGRRLDAQAHSETTESARAEYYDPWERPCTMGRAVELWEARSKPELAIEAEIPNADDERWWRLAHTEVELRDGETLEISTVWLGLNRQYGEGPPLIFETVAFREEESGLVERYSTRKDAVAGHERTVRFVAAMQARGARSR